MCGRESHSAAECFFSSSVAIAAAYVCSREPLTAHMHTSPTIERTHAAADRACFDAAPIEVTIREYTLSISASHETASSSSTIPQHRPFSDEKSTLPSKTGGMLAAALSLWHSTHYTVEGVPVVRATRHFERRMVAQLCLGACDAERLE
jgi:hypothetical protein